MEKESNQCHFPDWLGRHHDWKSIGDGSSIHLNKKGHSLKLRNVTAHGDVEESHVTCHKVDDVPERQATRVVAHVKAGW